MSEESIDVTEGANVLVLGGSGQHADRCCDALLDVGSAENRAELTVSFPEDVTDRTRFDTGTTGRQSAKRGHVTVGDVLRSADHSPPDFADPVATDIVEDPGDLKAIGASVSRFCEAWSEDGHLMVCCFDSLSELLDRCDPKVVFQFLHTLLERLASVDTVAHFHLDPDRFDEQTVSTFSSLFDEVIDPATADDLVDESGLEAAETDDGDRDELDAAEQSSASPASQAQQDADDGPSLSDGIPSTSGSSQASDDEIAARLDEHGEEYEVADGGTEARGASRQASDDDIAAQIPDVDDDVDAEDDVDAGSDAEDAAKPATGGEGSDGSESDTDAEETDGTESDTDAEESGGDEDGGSAIAETDEDADVDDLEFDFG